jgi:hypothetical protein
MMDQDQDPGGPKNTVPMDPDPQHCIWYLPAYLVNQCHA